LRGKPADLPLPMAGSVYVNNEDSSELHYLDAATLKTPPLATGALQIAFRPREDVKKIPHFFRLRPRR